MLHRFLRLNHLPVPDRNSPSTQLVRGDDGFLVFAFHRVTRRSDRVQSIWVFIGEIFPNEVRASGQSLGSLTHWVFAAIIANIFPYAAARFGGAPIFAFFTAMMVLQLLYVTFMMPETKGIALEDMESPARALARKTKSA